MSNSSAACEVTPMKRPSADHDNFPVPPPETAITERVFCPVEVFQIRMYPSSLEVATSEPFGEKSTSLKSELRGLFALRTKFGF